MPYRRRIVDAALDELMPHLAAIALEGAKGVGKTATASQRAKTLLNLADPRQREVLSACLLYTSDAADERSSVDLGGRRIIKKKTKREQI